MNLRAVRRGIPRAVQSNGCSRSGFFCRSSDRVARYGSSASWNLEEPIPQRPFERLGARFADGDVDLDLLADLVDVGEINPDRTFLSNPDAVFDAVNPSSENWIHAESEGGRTNQHCGEPGRLIGSLFQQNAVDASHFTPVPIDDLLIEDVVHDIHVTLQKFPAE